VNIYKFLIDFYSVHFTFIFLYPNDFVDNLCMFLLRNILNDVKTKLYHMYKDFYFEFRNRQLG